MNITKWVKDQIADYHKQQEYRLNHLVTSIELKPDARYVFIIARRELPSSMVSRFGEAVAKMTGHYPIILRVFDPASTMKILELTK